MIKIGIDLGGTKIEGIALSETGDELCRHRIATPQGDYQRTLLAIKNLIDHIEAHCAETGSIGLCTPGSLSPVTGLLRNSNSVCMNGKQVLTELQDLLQRDIRMANDANCFALSEATDGAGKDAAVVFGVIIGTGTGAGLVIDKKVLLGANAIAGEWGHNPLPWPENFELP
ncbi:MAG: ROK family protein, partial [Gammaproteobacteria bacterium]|nr:ROK family protein [Gammaproteobacteria bacterium]